MADRKSLPIFKYHGSTIYFTFPNENDLAEDVDFEHSSFEDSRNTNIIESQLTGPLRAFFAGDTFRYKDGVFEEKSSPTSLIVSLSGFEGIIDRIAIGRGEVEDAWSGLNPVGTNWLWTCIIEEDNIDGQFESSRMRGQWEPVSTDTSAAPVGKLCVLQATFESGIGINDNPPGKIPTLPSLGGHVLDNQNPHGNPLFQDTIVASGVEVLAPLSVLDLNVSGVIIDVLRQGDFFSGLQMQTYRDFDNVIVEGTFIFHGDLTVSGQNVTDEEAKLAALDHVLAGTIGQLLITSGLEVTAESTFKEDITILSGILVDGRNISGLYAPLDDHINDLSNPHLVNSGQVTGLAVTLLDGGTISGDLFIQSGFSVDGVNFKELSQFLDGSVISIPTHLHTVGSSGLQFMGFAPEHTAFQAFVGTADDVDFVHFSGTNLGNLSGFDSLVYGHIRQQLPSDIGQLYRMSFKQGIGHTLSGIEAVFDGIFRIPGSTAEFPHINATVPGLKLAMMMNEEGGDVSKGERYNLIADGPGPVWEPKVQSGNVTRVEAAGGILFSGANFENGSFPEALQIPFTNRSSAARDLLKGSEDFTIAFWINPENTFSDLMIIDENFTSSATPRLQIFHDSSNRIRVNMQRESGSASITSATVVDDAVFNHFMIVIRLSADAYDIYKNGVLFETGAISGSGPLTSAPSNNEPTLGLAVGARASFGSGLGNPSLTYDGIIDILLGWPDNALNNEHANELYNSGVGVEFMKSRVPTVAMQIKDSAGGILAPFETAAMKDLGVTEIDVDLFGGSFSPDAFFETQFVLSGSQLGEAFFGSTAIQYSPSNLPLTGEVEGFAFVTTG